MRRGIKYGSHIGMYRQFWMLDYVKLYGILAPTGRQVKVLV